uniref:Uncharacterized protein n=1 Tax=Manihot esculenta TaxID=3983 RepID=A0A2C9VDX8_MANES
MLLSEVLPSMPEDACQACLLLFIQEHPPLIFMGDNKISNSKERKKFECLVLAW